MSNKFNPYFDPDEIVITKDILYKIIDATINRWKKQPKRHFFQIKGMQLFRSSLYFQKEEGIAAIVKAIIIVVNKMQMYNAMLRLKNENPSTEVLANMAIDEIERGFDSDVNS